MELPTEAILHGRGVTNDDEFVDPGDSIRVGAANGIRFLASAENTQELPHYPGFKFKQELVVKFA
jgi:hypothetical protein